MFLATTGLVWAVSAGVGPLLGGVFTQFLNWRWVFWINLPCCFAAFVLLYFFLDARTQAPGPRAGRKMDWIGTATIMSTTILILLSLDFGGVVFPWNSPKIISILVSGLVLFVVFAIWEAKGASDPLIPMRLLNSFSKASPLFVCFTHGVVWEYPQPRSSTAQLISPRSTFPHGISSRCISKQSAAPPQSDLAYF